MKAKTKEIIRKWSIRAGLTVLGVTVVFGGVAASIANKQKKGDEICAASDVPRPDGSKMPLKYDRSTKGCVPQF